MKIIGCLLIATKQTIAQLRKSPTLRYQEVKIQVNGIRINEELTTLSVNGHEKFLKICSL